MVGQTLAHYVVLEKIASGVRGDVYLAQDTKLDRKIALKVLPPEVVESEERRERLKREAKRSQGSTTRRGRSRGPAERSNGPLRDARHVQHCG